MQRFAKTIRQNLEAVRNAMSEPWSNGQTEGQINRLKTLNRAMYGRADVELLRARMIRCKKAICSKVNQTLLLEQAPECDLGRDVGQPDIGPYRGDLHDPMLLARMLGFYTYQEPNDLLFEGDRTFTMLQWQDGSFMPFAVTPEEMQAARRTPGHHRVFQSVNSIRIRLADRAGQRANPRRASKTTNRAGGRQRGPNHAWEAPAKSLPSDWRFVN